MEIKIFNEESMPLFKTDRTHIVISIQEPDHDFIQLPKQESRIGWTGISCWDFDQRTDDPKYDNHLFSDKHAEDILTLVEITKSFDPLVCINCVAGISRSAGVAGSLAKIYNGDDSYFFKHYSPNMLVYRTIFDLALEKGWLAQ